MNTAFLLSIINSFPGEVKLLREIRDKKNIIVDFELIRSDDNTNAAEAKTFLSADPANKQFFHALKELSETNGSFQSGYLPKRIDQHGIGGYIKLHEFILISENGVDKKATDRDGTINEVLKELTEKLVKENRELRQLNTELKAISSVITVDYIDTIKMLYTNLEYLISHDARNFSDPSKGNVRKSQAAMQRLKLLSDDVNSFLQLYDMGVHRKIIDPNGVLGNVISAIKGKLEDTNTTIEYSDLPDLIADPLLLSILFRQVIGNSIKFRKLAIPTVISIKSSRADELNGVPLAVKNLPYTIISISDNGIGFNEEHADKIFDLFYRAVNNWVYKGSGMGLAICKKIMTLHEGFITAESITGRGTIINCYFPAIS